jgi:CBS domain-containing protein
MPLESGGASMTVKAILASKGNAVVTIDPAVSLADAVKMLADRRIGAVIITGGGDRVIGLLSERDIVRTLAEKGPIALAMSVESVMTKRVITVTESETVGEVMERMTHGKFRHLPVVEGERLVGLVSIGDVVKHRLEQMEAETSAMRDYIATA